MKKNRLISSVIISLITLNLSSSVLAQSLYTQTGTDVTWKYIMDNKLIPLNQTSTKGITGSTIDVNQEHPAISSSPYKNRAIISTNMSVHTLGNETVPRVDFPKWSRWYQEDGNTQVFRLFKDEINVRNDTWYKPRVEAELKDHVSGGKINNSAAWAEWSGTYTVVKPAKCEIFQIWGSPDVQLMLHMKTTGEIQLNPRDGSGFKTMVTNATGKSFNVRVRDYGNKYEVYLNDALFFSRTYTRTGGGHFRWGMYHSGDKVSSDCMMFVTGAQVKYSNDSNNPVDPIDPINPLAKGPAGYKYAVDEAKIVTKKNVPMDIAYGQDGKYVYLTNQTTDVTCNNTSFGSDPFPGVKKYCFVRESKLTSVEEEESLLFSVYPNPSLDGVFHLSNVFDYEVFDAQGHLVVSKKDEIVDLSLSSSGVYILKVGSKNVKLIR